MCTMDCVSGCVCASGFARKGRDGECVKISECGAEEAEDVQVELCASSPSNMCRMLCRGYTCKKGQCAMLGMDGAFACCNNYQCVADEGPSDPVKDPRCRNKECGDVCATNGSSWGGSVGVGGGPIGIGRGDGFISIGRRLTSMMAPSVMQYCQPDGTCDMNAAPECGSGGGPVDVPSKYPDPRCPARPEGMFSICSIDPTCDVKGACEKMGKICCKRACGGLECVAPPSDDEPTECERMGCDKDPCCSCNNGMPMMMGCAAPPRCANGREARPAPGQCCAGPSDCEDEPVPCQKDARVCPDGSSVSREGPNCEFPECPEPVACPEDAKICPDGTALSREGPGCEFPECPGGDDCEGNEYVGKSAKQLKKARKKLNKPLKKCDKFETKLGKAEPGSKAAVKTQKKLRKLGCDETRASVAKIEAAKQCSK